MSDTIVIGAGLAGLSAAKRLLEARQSVILIEARDRPGGRVWTRRADGIDAPIELGAEWIGSSGGVRQLIEEEGAKLDKSRGSRWECSRGQCKKLPDLTRLTQELLKKARHLDGADRSVASALEECCAGAELEQDRKHLLTYIEGFHAADPQKVGLRWLEEVEDSDSAKEYEMRSMLGAGRAIDALLASLQARCDLRFSTTAREIRWQRGEVVVEIVREGGESEALRGTCVIVTVPLPLLIGSTDSVARIRFAPDLPEKLRVARGIEMGQVMKIVFRFREPFWRKSKSLEDFLFLHSPDQPFPTWWTCLDRDVPILTAWAGGPRVSSAAIRESPLDAALDSLSAALGLPRREIDALHVETIFHDWSSDPFACGAYTYGGVGSVPAFEELGRPVENTLFFAGEATCGGGMNATMEGALRSGRRAAEEVLALQARA